MSPTDYNTMLHEVSNHMARSQLRRRLSTNSSSTTSSSRRGSARVTKLNSAGSSPHNVQRRRTTASHTARNNPRNLQDYLYQTREQWLGSNNGSRQALPVMRPMSWHPRSETLQTPGTQEPINEPALGNTISGFENLAVTNTPASSVQYSIKNAFSMGYGYPTSSTPRDLEQQMVGSQGYESIAAMHQPDPLSMYTQYPSHNFDDQNQYQHMVQPLPHQAYPPQNLGMPQWPHFEPDFVCTNQDHYNSFMPVQPAIDASQVLYTAPKSQLPKKQSKELVGIGLYDNEDRDYMSTLNSAGSNDPRHESMGKELKLEETWEPPRDGGDAEEENEEDEAYSTDDAEEIEEEVQAFMGPTPADSQTAFYPTYGDLSDQSFFFSDDDQFTHEDQYANYLALDGTLQEGQPKAQAARNDNFLWV